MIKSLTGKSPASGYPIIDYDEIQNGDYFLVGREALVFQEFDELKPPEYLEVTAPVREHQKPKIARCISDVRIPVKNNPLQRYSDSEYKSILDRAVKLIEKGVTPVISLPMGAGKTTHLMWNYIRYIPSSGIYVTMPNVRLALDVYASIEKAKKDRKETHLVGKQIDGIISVTGARIVVQTPAYLNAEVPNVIDEFQFLSHFNVEKISNRAYWKRLILMSATPFTPLLAAAQLAGVIWESITGRPVRTRKAWFLRGKLNRGNPDSAYIPNRCVLFGRGEPSEIGDSPVIHRLRDSLPGRRKTAAIVHPNLCFGYNPDVNFVLGVVDFKRHIYCATDNPAVIVSKTSLPIDFESAVQALGRCSRNEDGPRVLILDDVASYSLHRFVTPQLPQAPFKELNGFAESYVSKTAPQGEHKKTFPPSIQDWFVNVRDSKIKLNGRECRIDVQPKVKSVWGITINGPHISAMYTSEQPGGKNELIYDVKPIIDTTTKLPIASAKLTECIPGSFPVFCFNEAETFLPKVFESIKENGFSTTHINGYFNIILKKAPFKHSEFKNFYLSAMTYIMSQTGGALRVTPGTTADSADLSRVQAEIPEKTGSFSLVPFGAESDVFIQKTGKPPALRIVFDWIVVPREHRKEYPRYSCEYIFYVKRTAYAVLFNKHPQPSEDLDMRTLDLIWTTTEDCRFY